jgi:hypothetical protein
MTLMTFLSEHAPLLKSLQLSHVRLMNTTTTSLYAHHSGTEQIISCDPAVYHNMLPASVRVYHGHDPLEHLNWSAVKPLQHLEEIDIRVIPNGEEEMTVLCAFAPYLRYFTYQDPDSYMSSSPIVRAIARCCPRIESLSIQLCPQQQSHCIVTSEEMMNLLTQSCHHIKKFNISDLQFTDRILSMIRDAGWCRHLTELAMDDGQYITDEGLQSLISQPLLVSSSFGALKTLVFQNNSIVSSDTIAHLLEMIQSRRQDPLLATSSGIIHLDFAGCSFVNSQVLHAIVLYCPYLKSLNLLQCFGIQSEDWMILKELSDLTCLNIGESYSMTASLLVELCQSCRLLTHLDITDCPYISSIVIQSILAIPWKRMQLTAMGVTLKQIPSLRHVM